MWPYLLGITVILLISCFVVEYYDNFPFIRVILTVIFGFATIASRESEPEIQALRKTEAAEKEATKLANREPRFYSKSADGCTVFTFLQDNDKWGYYTKCPNSTTTTDFAYSVRSGKSTKEVREQIITEDKK